MGFIRSSGTDGRIVRVYSHRNYLENNSKFSFSESYVLPTSKSTCANMKGVTINVLFNSHRIHVVLISLCPVCI